MQTKREEYKECYIMAGVFDTWLNVDDDFPPDPESVRSIQQYWKILKEKYGVLDYNG